MSVLNTTINDSEARFVSADGDPQHAGFALKRRWERIHASSVDTRLAAINAVDTYGSPKADRKPYEGTFIQSALDPQVRADDAIDIQQTLTKVKAIVAEADADIVSAEGDPKAGGYKLNRAWHYMNPYVLDTLMPVLEKVTSVTNPKGNEETQTGKFVVSRVRAIEQNDRTYDIAQDMVRVRTIGSDTDLLNPLIDRAKDIIHPFGEGTGVGRDIVYRYINLDPASDTKLMAIADTTLTAKMSQNDSFIHVSRKSRTEEDRTLTFWVLAQRKQRIAWTPTIYAAPDHIVDQNPSRDGSVRRKQWFGIDNDCYAGVKARLDLSVDVGYSILSAVPRDNDDGSDDWTQMSIKQFNDTQTDSRILNTHGIEHNGIQTIHSDFDNYATEPATPTLAVGYKYEQEKVWKDARGLISKRVIMSKPTPSNGIDTLGRVDSFMVTGVRGGDNTDMNGIGTVTQRTYDQVALTDVDSAMRAMDNTGDTRFVIPDISYTDIGNGAASIRRGRKRINLTESWFVEEFGSPNNGGAKSLRRTWPFVLDTKGAALVAANGDANDTFTYGGVTYLPMRSRRTKHYDGTSSVWQFGAEASSLTAIAGGGVVRIGENTDSEIDYRFIVEVGLQEEVETYQKVFKGASAFANAKAFANRSDAIITSGGTKKLGSVKWIAEGQWQGFKVLRTA